MTKTRGTRSGHFYSQDKWLPGWAYKVIGEESVLDALIGRRPVSWLAFILMWLSLATSLVALFFGSSTTLGLHIFTIAAFLYLFFSALHVYLVTNGPVSLKRVPKTLLFPLSLVAAFGVLGFLVAAGHLRFGEWVYSLRTVFIIVFMLSCLGYILLRGKK